MTTTARAVVRNPDGTDRPSPEPKATTATARASAGETSPAGIGLPGLCPASRGASTRSFVGSDPELERGHRDAEPQRVGQRRAREEREHGGRRSRRGPTETGERAGRGQPARARAPIPGRRRSVRRRRSRRSFDEVLDQAGPAVGDLRADPGNERKERDRRDHEPAIAIAPDHGRWAAARSEHPFEFWFAQAGGRTEVIDHADDAATDHDVAHELSGPGVDLLVALLRETLRYSFGSAERPVVATSSPDASVNRAEYARVAAQPAGGCGRSPSGQSLKTSVSQRPTGPGGEKSGWSATRACSAVQQRVVRASTASREADRSPG